MAVMMNRRAWMVGAGAAWLGAFAPHAVAAEAVVRRARAFLSGLIDPELDLLPEFRGSSTLGFITDYTADGKTVGFANVETTSLCVLALE
jgi:hypothetical protein